MALCALSSDIAASALISSRSCARVIISKSCSINHGPLRLVLGHCCFCTHFIQIMRQGVHLLLAFLLCSNQGLISAGSISERLISVGKLSLSIPSVPVSLFKKGSCFFQGVLVGMA